MKKIFLIIVLFCAWACTEKENCAPTTIAPTTQEAIEKFLASGEKVGTLRSDGTMPKASNPNGAMPDWAAVYRKAKPIIESPVLRYDYGCGSFGKSRALDWGNYSPITVLFRPFLVITDQGEITVDSIGLWESHKEDRTVNEQFISRLNRGKMPQTIECTCQPSELGMQAVQVIEFWPDGTYKMGAYWIKGSFDQIGLPKGTRYLVTTYTVPSWRPYEVEGGLTLPQTIAYDYAWFNGHKTPDDGAEMLPRLTIPCNSFSWDYIRSMQLTRLSGGHWNLLVKTKNVYTESWLDEVLISTRSKNDDLVKSAALVPTEGFFNHSGGLLTLPKGYASDPFVGHTYGWNGWNGKDFGRKYSIDDDCPRVK